MLQGLDTVTCGANSYCELPVRAFSHVKTSRYNMCTVRETFIEAQFAFRRSRQCDSEQRDSELDCEIELEGKELNNELGILLS